MPVALPDFALTLLLALVATLVVVAVTHLVVVLTRRRWPVVAELSRYVAVPFRLSALVLVLAFVCRDTRPEDVTPGLWQGVLLALRLASIGTVAWLVGALLLFLEDLGLQRYRTDVSDNRNARRLRTQVLVIRRLTVAVVVLVAVGAALLTFPGVRAVGASLLASAACSASWSVSPRSRPWPTCSPASSSPSATRSGSTTWSSWTASGAGSRS